MLDGIPLIAYTIQAAQRYAERDNVTIALSTDSESIREVARDFGLISDYIRPEHLANDKAGKISVIKHILCHYENKKNIRFEYVLDLDVTSPMRTIEDLVQGKQLIESNERALSLFSVNSAARNPYFNMVEQKEDGYYQIVSKTSDVLSRQCAPKVFDLNASFYFYRRHFFDYELNTPISEHSLIYEMPHICFDLDHPIDFEFLEFLISQKKLEFDIWKS
jgi:CMP-N,N'-diacetyllegionaminic acid synthase